MVFCVSKFQKKMGEFAVSIKHSEAKSVSASGGLRPPDPRPGALLGTPPSGPRYRFALRALAMVPPLPNPKHATAQIHPLQTNGQATHRSKTPYSIAAAGQQNGILKKTKIDTV